MDNLKKIMSAYLINFPKYQRQKFKMFILNWHVFSENNVFWWKNIFPRGSDIILPNHL